MILNRFGVPFRRAKKLASVIVCASADGHPPWKPLMPKDVPDWIKDPDVMGNMIGEWIELVEAKDDVTTEKAMQRIAKGGGFNMSQGPKGGDWYIVLPLVTGINALFDPSDAANQR